MTSNMQRALRTGIEDAFERRAGSDGRKKSKLT